MDSNVLIAILVVLIIAAFGAALILGGTFLGGGIRSQARTLVSAGRADSHSEGRFGSPERPVDLEKMAHKTVDSRLTLVKKLKFAQWPISPLTFRVAQVILSSIAFYFTYMHLNRFFQLLSLFTGPLIMGWLISMFIERRFLAFDQDYPAFLLSLVGLLKTGMNPMGALEAAAQGLEEGSLVKQEVELMLERLRFGVSEDKSVGSFGEDIFHPEIELFVQALLLSRRVGGTLSDTLDRLAKQVRKRQYFRRSAVAAVGLQRGSIWFILGILFGLEVYLYFMFPESVIDAWKDDMGWQVWQGGIACIILGIYWVRQVTKIRV